ncbi:MAG: TIM barrel protein [archaeon]|jgi:deoxyribonuclease-4
MSFKKLLFGTAGIPLSTADHNTIDGIKQVHALGLSGMELEFVHSVHISKEQAPEVKKVAQENEVILTSHGSYYINLNAVERPKMHASVSRVVACARRAEEAGAVSMTFHAGFYLKDSPEKTFSNIKKCFEEITDELGSKKSKITIRPETTGKGKQFGSIDELLLLCSQLDNVLPCIDFSHLHARSNGKYNTYEEFRSVLENSEKMLGKGFLKNMHCHVSGIAYSEKGEQKHLVLKESDFNYTDLLKALKEFDCAGMIVCESPNIETDALLLKKTYEKL